jgi:hypothetical protein
VFLSLFFFFSSEPGLQSPGAPEKAVRRRCGIVPVSPTAGYRDDTKFPNNILDWDDVNNRLPVVELV